MKKLTLTALALALGLLVVPVTARSGAERPIPPPPPPPGYGSDYLYRSMNYMVPGEDMIDLRQQLGIGGQHYGRRIEFVVIRASANQGPGQASLMINSRRNGPTQQLDFATRDFYFYPDSYSDDMDHEVQLLKVYLRGNIHLEGVGVRFLGGNGGYPPPPPPPPMQERASVRTNFIGTANVPVEEYMRLDRYRGYRLSRVILRASKPQFPPISGDVTFCSSRGCAPMQSVHSGSREHVFYGNGELVDPYETRYWRFETKGGVYIDSFTVQFGY